MNLVACTISVYGVIALVLALVGAMWLGRSEGKLEEVVRHPPKEDDDDR